RVRTGGAAGATLPKSGEHRMPGLLEGSVMNQIVACPEPGCDVAAEVVSRWVWPSTDGPVEHVKVFCLHGHARTLLSAWIVTPARSAKVVYPSTRWN
ncbi:MAG TPA: hypothetical protein VFS70_06650, partial [Actinomycetota bacterium]|nr:hypothetical protein [Actinomycetota bacterium]